MKQIAIFVMVMWLVLPVPVLAESTDEPVNLFDEISVLWNLEVPDEPRNIQQIDFEQVALLSGKEVLKIEAVDPPPGFMPAADAEIKVGATLSSILARRVVFNLFESGKYARVFVSAVPYGNDGAKLLIEVEPMYRIAAVQLSGNEAMNDSEIKRAIGFTPGVTIIPTTQALTALQNKLKERYTERGYPLAEPRFSLQTTAKAGEVTLEINIVEGPPETYDVIVLHGFDDPYLPAQLLRRSRLTSGLVCNQDVLEEKKDALLELINEMGYPDAEYAGDDSRERIGERSFKLDLYISPGLYTETAFEGNNRLRVRKMAELLKEKRLLTTSANGLKRQAEILQAYAVSHGLFHAQVVAQRTCFNSADQLFVPTDLASCPADAVSQKVTFQFAEGKPVEVEDVLFKGLSFFTPGEMRTEVFAYMSENGVKRDLFDPFGTETVLRTVAGYNETRAAQPNRMTRNPLERVERIYTPENYQKVCQHLMEVYAEEGFLSAQITDTCDIENQEAIVLRGELYRPLEMPEEDGGRPCVFMDGDHAGMLVRFKVEEGVRTLLHELKIVGNNPDVFTESELLTIAGLYPGEPYNEYYIEQGKRDIARAYMDRGYMFVSVNWDSEISSDGTTASVAITIIEGPQVTVGDIDIHAESTNRKFIANNLGFKSGDIYTPAVRDTARTNLMEIGVFDSVSVEMRAKDIPKSVKDIVITLIEAKPQYLELTAGIATVEGVRGGFEYGHRHIGGLAMNFRLKVRGNYREPGLLFLGPDAQAFKDDLETRYNEYNLENPNNRLPHQFRFFEWYILAGFGVPNVMGTSGNLGMGVDVSFKNVNRTGYSKLELAPRYRVKLNWSKHFPVEMWTGIDTSIVIPSSGELLDSISIGDRSYQRSPSGRAVFWVNSVQFSVDFRDSPLNPRQGVFLSLRNDYIHSMFPRHDDVSMSVVLERYPDFEEDEAYIDENNLGDEFKSRYIKSLATLTGYIPLGSKRNVLALSASGGYIFHLNDNPDTKSIRPAAWADRMFYVGGVSTLRGFGSDSLVPQDLWGKEAELDQDGTPTGKEKNVKETGGQSMLVLRSEFSHDFGSNIVGALFFEVGNLWRDETLFMQKRNGDFAPFLLRPVSGVGFHYITPVGPLSFDFGVNLDPRPGEAGWGWYFSVGSAF